MKALADKRQGQDGKLEADDGSDEAFLEQAKLRAQQTLRNILLGEDNDATKYDEAFWRKPSSRPEEPWDAHF